MYWRNYGCKKLKTMPVLIKTYYVFVNPEGSDEITFKRLSYHLENDDRYLTLVHYKGDHTVMKQYKDLKKQTCASVRGELEKQEQSPSVVYKKNVYKSVPNEYQSIFTPKNPKQVSNLQSRQQQKLRLSHDALYNLHELCYDLEVFVHKIITYPDLIVICGLRPMLREINRLLSVFDGHLMSYDTFQLGDFYLSPLLFRNVLFSKSPVVPVGFLLHEQKLKNCQEEMMRVMASHLPSLVDGNNTIPLVTDDEKGFAAIENNLPKIFRLLCCEVLVEEAWCYIYRSSSICQRYLRASPSICF